MAGAGIVEIWLNLGLRIVAAVVSRPTTSSQRTCMPRMASRAGVLPPGPSAYPRSALANAQPVLRSSRIIMGGAACRGR
jgi:hypothetical protein